jgi:hypothetical protein
MRALVPHFLHNYFLYCYYIVIGACELCNEGIVQRIGTFLSSPRHEMASVRFSSHFPGRKFHEWTEFIILLRDQEDCVFCVHLKRRVYKILETFEFKPVRRQDSHST